jgi:hypothetical protein
MVIHLGGEDVRNKQKVLILLAVLAVAAVGMPGVPLKVAAPL